MLEIPSFQQDDAGSYECVAENSRGRNVARGRLTYYGRCPRGRGSGSVSLIRRRRGWGGRSRQNPVPHGVYAWLNRINILGGVDKKCSSAGGGLLFK